LPIASLLFFGGATLKDFAFALLVGVVSGAYSSIFIAAPLLTMWKEREPEFARRQAEVALAGDGAGEAVLVAAEQAAAVEPASSSARSTRSSSCASRSWSTGSSFSSEKSSSRPPSGSSGPPCNTDAVATRSTQQRNLGRLSEIAQVAVRHGFGYFLEKHKLTD